MVFLLGFFDDFLGGSAGKWVSEDFEFLGELNTDSVE